MGVVLNFFEMLIVLLLTGKSGCTFGWMVGPLFMSDVDGETAEFMGTQKWLNCQQYIW